MKNTAFCLFSLTMLSACSPELAETANDIIGDKVMKVTVQSHPFEFDDDTRTTLTASDKSITFSWTDHDAMGVFPVEPYSNSQAKRTLSVPAGADAHYATFDGAGWELNQNNTYAAYVPYNGSLPSSTSYKEVPVDLTGQDGTLETIGKKYDYMYATSTRGTFKNLGCKNTEIVFDFEHAVSIIQLNLTMPVAAEWKSVTLANRSSNKVWITSATMNVATGEVVAKEASSVVTLSLHNMNTTASNKTLTLYLAVLPTTVEGIVLTATTSDNKSYAAYIKSKKFKAGKAYRITESVKENVGDGIENGYSYIDLDLPSGLKWATMNVGATSITDYGGYYAWGETMAYGEEYIENARNYSYKGDYKKTYYNWRTYKWSTDNVGGLFSKYTIDTKTTLDQEDDAAVQNWGGAWRMPTHEEMEELKNCCKWVWTSSYNGSSRAGYIVYAVSDDSHNAHIFLPVAGYYSNMTLNKVGVCGDYWSSSLGWTENHSARNMYLKTDTYEIYYNSARYQGFSVRAVCK